MKNWKNKLLLSLGVKVDLAGTAKTADGTEIYFDTEEIEQGTMVFADAEGQEPMADGTYELENGDSITVAGGQVTEITKAAGGDDDQDEEELNQAATKADLVAAVEKLVELANESADAREEKMREEFKTMLAKVPGGKDALELAADDDQDDTDDQDDDQDEPGKFQELSAEKYAKLDPTMKAAYNIAFAKHKAKQTSK